MDDNKQLLQNLQSDVKSAESYHDKWRLKRAEWIKEYNGEPYGNEEKGKSQVVSRDIKKASSHQHASIIDPFVSSPNMVRCIPIGPEDEASAKQAELLLNYQFCRDFDRYNFVSEGFKVLQREGTVIAKVSWESEEREVDVEVPVYREELVPGAMGLVPQKIQSGTQIEKRMETVINRPHAEICDNVMLYIDPTCVGDISNAQFIAYKYMSNISKLKGAGLYKNLEKISETEGKDYDFSYDQYDKRDSIFRFADSARKEFEVVEYWGNYDLHGDGVAIPIVCVWAGNNIIRLEENPYPDKGLPFVSCAYDAEPFSINGNANADLISADQKIKTGVKRAFVNTLDSSTNGQKGIRKGSLDPLNLRKFKAGQDFEFNDDSADIWEGNFSDIPASTINFYNGITSEIESLTGVREYSAGQGGNGLGSSAAAVQGNLAATEKREVDISRNFKENFITPLLRKWQSLNSEFLAHEKVIRVTCVEFVPVRRDDMDGNVDIDIQISTAATDTERANKIAFMLQTMAQSLPFELVQILLAEQADLARMPGLSDKIANYQQQPDQLELEKQQLEVEKLKAEIEERRSRAQENQVDMRLKSANAAKIEAEARRIHGEADLKDKEYVDDVSGKRRQIELEDKIIDHRAAKDLQANKPSGSA